MDGYVAKPLQIEALLAILAEIGLTQPPSAKEPEAAVPAGSGFDLDQALQHAQGDMALLRELVSLFLDECPTHLQAMRQAIAGRNAQTLQHAAHTLKGSAAVISAVEVQALAQRIESAAREQNWDEVDRNWGDLESAAERLRPALESFAGDSKT
jgi:HPt (histidine-containing phosphotransfer) domain-containing protein